MKIILSVTLSLTLVATSSAHAANPPWHEVAHYVLGGNGGWDLMTVDASARRLYVTRGDHLMVVDIDHGTLIGDIRGLQRAHAVAVVPSRRRGYVSSGAEDAVVVFDLDSLAVTGKIPVDHNPDAVIYDTRSERVLAFNAGSNSVSVIDPAIDKRIATIALPGKPELAVSDEKGGVFVNLEDVSKLARLDIGAARVTFVWSLPDCEEPSGIAIDAQHARVFSVCQNHHMVVTNARTGQHVTSVEIGSGPDGAAFDRASGDIFSSNSDGTLTVVRPTGGDHFTVAETVSTPKRSRCIALDPKTHRAILATARFGATPEPTAADPHPRPSMQADSFGLLIVGRD
jgi:YVTN family beta-propeller protein